MPIFGFLTNLDTVYGEPKEKKWDLAVMGAVAAAFNKHSNNCLFPFHDVSFFFCFLSFLVLFSVYLLGN